MLLALFSVSALFSQMSSAVLPPLSEKARFESASDIVTGYVTSVKKVVHKKGIDYSDTLYTAEIIVSEIVKGENVFGRGTLKFHFWKQLDRPRGWGGDGGQAGVIKHYQIIKVYLKYDERKNTFDLLGPNGFDLLQR
jgi:hypothetical protein